MDVRNWKALASKVTGNLPCLHKNLGLLTPPAVKPLSCVLAVGAALAIHGSSLYAKPVAEKTERIDIDWGSLKIRFSGQAEQPPQGSANYADGEKKAWTEGLLAVRDAVTTYHKDHLTSLGVEQTAADLSAKEAGDRVASSTYAVKTEYHATGLVKVYLENSLTRALQRNDLLFQQQKAPDADNSRFSGLVLRSDKVVRPQAAYRVVDETGRLLFDVSKVAKDAYEKNLMGRWFEEPTRSELTPAVGSKPVSLTFHWNERSEMVVQGAAWREAMQDSQAILTNARIAVVLPKP